jgi:hypothetical protein
VDCYAATRMRIHEASASVSCGSQRLGIDWRPVRLGSLVGFRTLHPIHWQVGAVPCRPRCTLTPPSADSARTHVHGGTCKSPDHPATGGVAMQLGRAGFPESLGAPASTSGSFDGSPWPLGCLRLIRLDASDKRKWQSATSAQPNQQHWLPAASSPAECAGATKCQGCICIVPSTQ